MELWLKENEMIDLSEKFKGYRVVCRKGPCWLTREGDSRDLIMSTGTEALIDSCSVIVTALGDVQLMLVSEGTDSVCCRKNNLEPCL